MRPVPWSRTVALRIAWLGSGSIRSLIALGLRADVNQCVRPKESLLARLVGGWPPKPVQDVDRGTPKPLPVQGGADGDPRWGLEVRPLQPLKCWPTRDQN